eukprot:TRINITY_DN50328_c0_g1_i1.p1 TRINITY_DN50328_c0_g1~~TRINITY_DN50328_c0_g1_i1.p1  ORF type:complete len:836 (-),score=214.71 TRINITY_DN50328_c0_g1_i1:116-2623(-)
MEAFVAKLKAEGASPLEVMAKLKAMGLGKDRTRLQPVKVEQNMPVKLEQPEIASQHGGPTPVERPHWDSWEADGMQQQFSSGQSKMREAPAVEQLAPAQPKAPAVVPPHDMPLQHAKTQFELPRAFVKQEPAPLQPVKQEPGLAQPVKQELGFAQHVSPLGQAAAVPPMPPEVGPSWADLQSWMWMQAQGAMALLQAQAQAAQVQAAQVQAAQAQAAQAQAAQAQAARAQAAQAAMLQASQTRLPCKTEKKEGPAAEMPRQQRALEAANSVSANTVRVKVEEDNHQDQKSNISRPGISLKWLASKEDKQRDQQAGAVKPAKEALLSELDHGIRQQLQLEAKPPSGAPEVASSMAEDKQGLPEAASLKAEEKQCAPEAASSKAEEGHTEEEVRAQKEALKQKAKEKQLAAKEQIEQKYRQVEARLGVLVKKEEDGSTSPKQKATSSAPTFSKRQPVAVNKRRPVRSRSLSRRGRRSRSKRKMRVSPVVNRRARRSRSAKRASSSPSRSRRAGDRSRKHRKGKSRSGSSARQRVKSESCSSDFAGRSRRLVVRKSPVRQHRSSDTERSRARKSAKKASSGKRQAKETKGERRRSSDTERSRARQPAKKTSSSKTHKEKKGSDTEGSPGRLPAKAISSSGQRLAKEAKGENLQATKKTSLSKRPAKEEKPEGPEQSKAKQERKGEQIPASKEKDVKMKTKEADGKQLKAVKMEETEIKASQKEKMKGKKAGDKAGAIKAGSSDKTSKLEKAKEVADGAQKQHAESRSSKDKKALSEEKPKRKAVNALFMAIKAEPESEDEEQRRRVKKRKKTKEDDTAGAQTNQRTKVKCEERGDSSP